MSDFGTIIDALETRVRAAVTDMPAGDTGWERNLRIGQDLPDEQYPHAFAHDPTEVVSELEFGQRQIVTSVEIDLWTRGETQEALSVRLDLIDAQVAANTTLGGAVDKAAVLTRAIREFPSKDERVGIIIVQTEVVE